MTVAEATAELILVNAAITRLLTGGVSEYKLGDREATYLDLGKLRTHRSDLERAIAAPASGGGVALARFRRAR